MPDRNRHARRLALISVSDKTGIVEFARALTGQGFELLSTGGTASILREAGLAITGVSEYTGFPEIMDGRVKTLHPKVHGGILARDRDRAILEQHGIAPIELVAVNLYPFAAVISDPACTLEQAVESIDIGGPAMLRAAAKNHAQVTVVVEAGDYPAVSAMLAEHGQVQPEMRLQLAVKAFAHTARYDGLVAEYLAGPRDRDATPEAAVRTDAPPDRQGR